MRELISFDLPWFNRFFNNCNYLGNYYVLLYLYVLIICIVYFIQEFVSVIHRLIFVVIRVVYVDRGNHKPYVCRIPIQLRDLSTRI